MAVRSYGTPATFKVALNAMLKNRAAATRRPVDRLRTTLVMERFLARVQMVAPNVMLLKGGFALELRLAAARATQDIDLRVAASAHNLAGMFAQIADAIPAPDDFLRFEIRPHPRHPTIRGDGVLHEGVRYVVTPTLAGQAYGQAFGVDVSVGDVVSGTPSALSGSDALAFVGIGPIVIDGYPLESHLAEKLHAYTLRSTGNTRTKDLVDIALIASHGELSGSELMTAVKLTFDHRATHVVPSCLPEPPAGWSLPYARMASANGLPWADLRELTGAATAFFDPVLKDRCGRWSPAKWSWSA